MCCLSVRTLTMLLCAGFGNLTAVVLFPLLIYYFQLGVSGAAITTVISQYVPHLNIFKMFHISLCYCFSHQIQPSLIYLLFKYCLFVRYIVTISMIYCLNKRAILMPPKFGELRFGDYLKSGKQMHTELLI